MASAARVNNMAEILEEACGRNLPLELHHRAAAGELQAARTRVLAMDERHVYTDTPQRIGSAVHFTRGQPLVAYLNFDGKWYQFRSRVAKSKCPVALNDAQTVIGMCITKPSSLKEAQRREDYRVSLACVEPITARLHETSPTDPNCCPLDAQRFSGSLADLSLGGLALCVDASERRDFRVNEPLFITFALPDDPCEMTFLVEVRHFHKILEGEATRLGLKFLLWNQRKTRENGQRIARFNAELQRRYLRNARSR